MVFGHPRTIETMAKHFNEKADSHWELRRQALVNKLTTAIDEMVAVMKLLPDCISFIYSLERPQS